MSDELTDRQRYVLDIALPCPDKKCNVAQWVPCRGLVVGIVHFARRLKRLLAERPTQSAREYNRPSKRKVIRGKRPPRMSDAYQQPGDIGRRLAVTRKLDDKTKARLK